MNDDVLFRKSIYGFNKADVLNYIEEIKKENENQKKIAMKSAEELSNAFKNIKDLEEQLLSKNQMADDYELNIESRQHQSKMNKGTQNPSSKTLNQSENTVGYSDEVERVKSENKKLKAALKHFQVECERFKNTEKQFGSMLLDAYIYSGNILDDAREKAEQITKTTKNTIEQATGDIGDLSSYVNNISIGFSQIVSELTSDIKKITENLMSVSQNFQSQTNDENKEVKVADINSYINDSHEQENHNELNDDNSLLSEKVSSFDDYIEIFENLISGEPSEIKNIEKYSREGISYAEHNVNELIGEYVQIEEENSQPQVKVNFISSEPICSDVELETEPLGTDENLENFEPLHFGMDYSSSFEFENDESYKNNNVKINDIVNEYVSSPNEKNIETDSKSRLVRVKIKNKKDK
ncbi:MAG: hypothetical protein EOM05_03355 [Clostridia bacterium]|nr:hypothetical protein [Clostridia bacterium]